jgi:hypothetical protein
LVAAAKDGLVSVFPQLLRASLNPAEHISVVFRAGTGMVYLYTALTDYQLKWA